MKKKRIGIIVVFLILILSALVFFIYQRQVQQPETNVSFELPDAATVDRFFTEETASSEQIVADVRFDSFRQLVHRPVAGYTTYKLQKTATNTVTVVRYVDRATGHIFDRDTSATSSKRVVAITNPKVQEALFLNKNTLVVRTLNENEIIRTTLIRLIEKDDSTHAESIVLEDNIRSIGISSKNTLAYVRITNNEPELVILDAELNRIIRTIPLPLKEWDIQILSNGQIFLTSKSGFGIQGSTFRINTQSNTLIPIIRTTPGLTFISNPSGTSFFYSSSKKGEHSNTLRTSAGNFIALPFFSLQSRCFWATESKIYCATIDDALLTPSYQLPDDWYKGKLALQGGVFSYEINSSNPIQFIFSSTQAGFQFDITNLVVGSENSSIFFINKNDLSLWEYKLR